MSSNVFAEFLDLYGIAAGEEGPVKLCREVFGHEPDEWQEEALRAYGRGDRGVSIRACHGPGKTFIAAVCAWHQLICRFPQNTVATAPSRSQLEDALVKEILVLGGMLPEPIQALYTVKKNRIELTAAPDSSFFSARTAREETPEALQGIHCDDGWVLLIIDEASGVPEKIFEAAGGSMSGERVTTLLLSNPTRTSGTFFDSHHKLRDRFRTIHVGYFPDPDTRPMGAYHSPRVSPEFEEDMRRRYGVGSTAYRVRVLGEFPLTDTDTVIPYALVQSAIHRDIIMPPQLMETWGVDVARYGDDDSVLVRRTRLGVDPDIRVWHGLDTMQVAGKVKMAWDEAPSRPDVILVDVIGIGSGVVDRLRELGLPARGVNVSEAASASERYRNLRTELWFRAKEWLETRDHKLPSCLHGCAEECPHAMLAEELTVPLYEFTSKGQLWVEPKQSMKRRGYKSPNVAEAFILTFAQEPATLLHGSQRYGSTNWNEPITRNVVHV